jgi:hypothetical protein
MLRFKLASSFNGVADLSPHRGPTKDQGSEGACTAHAQTEKAEWIYRAYPQWLPKGAAPNPIFSPQFGYANELELDGDFPQDNGSSGETACRVAISNGFCPISLYPYVPGKILRPTAAQVAAASKFRMGAYHGLFGSETAASVLADATPWPILIGFTVYESFESDAVAQTGIMPVPGRGERELGGHEVLILGCDLGVTPTRRPASCPPAFLLLNSWGAGWGVEKGMFWMPEEILNRQDTDLKVFHPGHPWRRA